MAAKRKGKAARFTRKGVKAAKKIRHGKALSRRGSTFGSDIGGIFRTARGKR